MTHQNNSTQALRKRLQQLEVPKTVIWVDGEMKVETTHLVDKNIDQLLTLFQEYAQSRVVEELETLLDLQSLRYEYGEGGNYSQGAKFRDTPRIATRNAIHDRIDAIKSQGSKEGGNG